MTTIKLKNGSGAPTAGDLVQGEPALDLTNKRLYTEDSGGTVIEVGTNPTSVTTGNITATGTATFAGLTTTADVSFGDNDKAIFGAGSDLQIYHDGSNSFITETGTGYLGIGTNGSKVIINKSPFENMAEFITDGAVNLYHNNSQKFATTSTGIDVTGTAVTDGVTVAGNILLQNEGNELQFNTSSTPVNKIYSDDTYTSNGLTISADNGVALKSTNNYLVLDDTGTNEMVLNVDSGERMRVTATGIDVTGDLSLTDATPAINLYDSDNSTRTGLFNNSGISYLNVYGITSGTYGAFILNSHNHTTSKEVLRADNTNIQFKTDGTLRGRFLLNGDYVLYNDAGTSTDFYWDASTSRLGLGTTSPATNLEVGADNPTIRLESQKDGVWTAGEDLASLEFYGSDTSGVGAGVRSAIRSKAADTFGSRTELTFSVTGTSLDTEAMRIDSSGNVGIGATSLSNKLSVNGDQVLLANGELKFADATNNQVGTIRNSGGAATSQLEFLTASTERMRIDSSGEIGIGNAVASTINASSGIGNLVVGSGSGNEGITIYTGSSSYGALNFADATSGAGAYAGYIKFDHSDNSFGHFIDNTERMRIDSSGNLLVGATTTTNLSDGTGNDGIQLNPSGTIAAARTSNVTAVFNRLSTDGEIARFNKDGTTVGSIGCRSSGSNLYIDTINSGIDFGGSGYLPMQNGSITDNAIDIGSSSFRYDDIFATNGTIQTSDRNEKQDIEELSEAEQRVAVACKGLLRKYRWKSAVEEKGDDARIHFGIIAQDLQDAFTAEGLDAGRYGMFINSTWTDEETGEERSRMGVRYSELLAFIISAI